MPYSADLHTGGQPERRDRPSYRLLNRSVDWVSVQCYSVDLKDFRRSSPLKSMDATLHQLGDILLRAVPTFLLVIFLNFYLKAVFFKPLEKVLQQRYAMTEGARQMAKKNLERA